jgi:hypothetical protein
LPDPSTLSWQELVTQLQSYPGIEDPRLRRELSPAVQGLWIALDGRVEEVVVRIVRHEWLNAMDLREIVERVLVRLIARPRNLRGTVLREAQRQIQKKQASIGRWHRSVVPLTAPLDAPIDEARRAQLQEMFDRLPERDRLLLQLAASTDRPSAADMARETGLKFSAVAVRRWRLWLKTHAILTAPRPSE